jgi:hypothetical protein
MGLLKTQWEAEHEGHALVVRRSELTRGFALEWDGREIARRAWSLIGLGELRGTAELSGRTVEVHVTIEFSGFDGKCTITVDGVEVPVRKVR